MGEKFGSCMEASLTVLLNELLIKVQVGNDQEKAQLEKDRDREKLN